MLEPVGRRYGKGVYHSDPWRSAEACCVSNEHDYLLPVASRSDAVVMVCPQCVPPTAEKDAALKKWLDAFPRGCHGWRRQKGPSTAVAAVLNFMEDKWSSGHSLSQPAAEESEGAIPRLL
jgi:hypothetical protein